MYTILHSSAASALTLMLIIGKTHSNLQVVHLNVISQQKIHGTMQPAMQPAMQAETRQWCARTKRTPESRLHIYNRIAKAGSSSMQSILGASSNENDVRKHAVLGATAALSVNSSLWGDLGHSDRTPHFMEKLRFVSYLSMVYNVSAVVDGHFPFFPIRDVFSMHAGDSATYLPYLQMMRDPVSRTISHFYYMKFESEDALRRQRERKDVTSEAGKGILSLGDECADNEHCRGWLSRRCRAQMTYISGIKDETMMLKNALKQASNPLFSHYAAIGLTEYFEESLEMFECVAPMTFQGASTMYRRQPVRKKEGVAHATAFVSQKTARLIEDYCRDERILHDAVNRTFWARYKAMKETPELCCRERLRFPS